MLFKSSALIVLLSIATPVANAQGFATGLLLGGAMSRGSDQTGDSAATILYTAAEETLRATDPLSMRMASVSACFHITETRNKMGASLGELFKEIEKDLPQKKKEWTILQVARVFKGDRPDCAAIWYIYTEKK